MTDGKVIALTPTTERKASTSSGYAMLIVLLLAFLVYPVGKLLSLSFIGRDGFSLAAYQQVDTKGALAHTARALGISLGDE